MSYWLNVFFALDCLALVVGGLVLIFHLSGDREHGPDCRICRVLAAVFDRPRRAR